MFGLGKMTVNYKHSKASPDDADQMVAGKASSLGLARFAGWQARQTLHVVFAVALGSTVVVPCASGQPDNHFDKAQALLPPMGFNTWNSFKMNPTEKVVRSWRPLWCQKASRLPVTSSWSLMKAGIREEALTGSLLWMRKSSQAA